MVTAARIPNAAREVVQEAQRVLPEGQAIIVGSYDQYGAYRVTASLLTMDGYTVDWEAVLGDEVYRGLLRRLQELAHSVESLWWEIHLWWSGGNVVMMTYSRDGSARDYILHPELPAPEKPGGEDYSGAYNRPLRDRVQYALSRYRTWYRNEAPRSWRERFPEQPTLEAMMAFGENRYWHPVENEVATRILQGLMEGKE